MSEGTENVQENSCSMATDQVFLLESLNKAQGSDHVSNRQ